MDQEQKRKARHEAEEYLGRAGIVITPSERQSLEVTDFGLGIFDRIGFTILVYINTQRCCAKEIVLFPRQICPEHRHPPVGNDPGKEETFRCRWGEVCLYLPGEPSPTPKACIPAGREEHFTVWREILLLPGDQYTLAPDTLHWFQAGPEGAVVSEFSTTSRDELDIFTNPRISRLP